MLDIYLRQEKKYLLDEQGYLLATEEIMKHMDKDIYALQRIHNVYFDNDSMQVIGTSIEKPPFKEKLRFRAYGDCNYAFLELKRKLSGVVYKRRITLTRSAADGMIEGRVLPAEAGEGQIAGEIDFFVKRYSAYPKIYIAYDRLSFKDRSGGDLRITFDSNITFRTESLYLDTSHTEQRYQEQPFYIMEIKTHLGLPVWLTEFLSKNRCYPCSFSKYGKIYEKFLSDGVLPRRALPFSKRDGQNPSIKELENV